MKSDTESMKIMYIAVMMALFCLVSSAHAITDSQDVYALNKIFTMMNSSFLPGWMAIGGDPCADNWEGVACAGPNVTILNLTGLGLAGAFGSALENLTALIVLDLSNNLFTGELPQQYPPHIQQLNMSDNFLSGTIPEVLGQLPLLTTLDLSNNALRGALPASFSGLSYLSTLYLQDNLFTGAIDVLATLPLTDLNVSNNSFSGWIPPELKKFPSSTFASNSFSAGSAPPPPPFSPPPDAKNAPSPSNTSSATPKTSTTTTHNNNVHSSPFTMPRIIAIAVAGLLTLILLSLVIAFLVSRSHRQKEDIFGSQKSWRASSWKAEHRQPFVAIEDRKEEPEPLTPLTLKSNKSFDEKSSELTVFRPPPPPPPLPPVDTYKVEKTVLKPPPNLDTFMADRSESSNPPKDIKVNNKEIRSDCYSIADLQVATDSFAETNLIGEGTLGKVYKAVLQNGQVVAVKKLDFSITRMTQEDLEKFLTKASDIRHPNITQLVGYCAEHGQCLLVYEYIRNGTLYENLQSEMKHRLEWKSRVEIALGVAKAVEYLHDEFRLPIVHRNLTSTNILLDDNFCPYLSDCGLAEFFSFEQNDPKCRGYIAPEYEQSGEYRPESDMYSFGVIMLELLTGRKAFDSSMPRAEQSLVRWLRQHHLHDMDILAKIPDPAISGYSKKALSLFVDVILKCLEEAPEFRPFAQQVVVDLQKILDTP